MKFIVTKYSLFLPRISFQNLRDCISKKPRRPISKRVAESMLTTGFPHFRQTYILFHSICLCVVFFQSNETWSKYSATSPTSSLNRSNKPNLGQVIFEHPGQNKYFRGSILPLFSNTIRYSYTEKCTRNYAESEQQAVNEIHSSSLLVVEIE